MNAHLNAHRRLIAHELGHALTGMLAGLRVKRVWAPPPEPDVFDAPPENPDELAGFVEFHRGGDQRAKALALLAGPLAEGKPAPAWPIEPRTNDERKLAKLVGEGDELTYLETVRDAEQIVKSDEFTRMNTLASELLAHPPHELDGKQLDHILGWKGHEEDEPPDPRKLEAALVRRGIITEPARAEQYERVDPVILGTGENGDHREKAYLARVRAESRDAMLALFDAADKQAPKPERKTAAPIQIATFEA